MARNIGPADVIDHCTLIGDELDLLRNKSSREPRCACGRYEVIPRNHGRGDRFSVAVTMRVGAFTQAPRSQPICEV
jgi:hypothetical protein